MNRSSAEGSEPVRVGRGRAQLAVGTVGPRAEKRSVASEVKRSLVFGRLRHLLPGAMSAV